jgi:hypothetical protein
MGWYQETGATWIGKALSPEESAKMPRTMPVNVSSNDDVMQQNVAVASGVWKYSYMRTNSRTGVSTEMICGSMSTSSGKTLLSYLCIQMGDLSSSSNWAEIVVTHNYGEGYLWWSFDVDEGGWILLGTKNTPSNVADTYVMLLDGTSDSGGYHYDIWINGQWQRRAHLPNYKVQVGFQKEVYSETGQFTDDTSPAVFYPNWLNNGSGWSYWTNSITTSWYTQAPICESHTTISSNYKWTTWTQN